MIGDMPNRPRKSYNPKRALVADKIEQAELIALAKKVHYGGNPEHKRNPGDFGLTPPSAPRPDKTLCDLAGITTKSEALSALRSGVLKGLISKKRGTFPQNIWSVTSDGIPLEAQLDNEEAGTYHGYPMPEADPFCSVILRAWNADE
jgi:hypothetical protein